MTSRFAKAFLLIALLYLLATAGDMWLAIQLVTDGYDSTQNKIFQITGAIGYWAVDPVIICGAAVVIEFLERIWRELVKRNGGIVGDANS